MACSPIAVMAMSVVLAATDGDAPARRHPDAPPPDLDRIRLRVPAVPREIWMEGRAGGVHMPATVAGRTTRATTIYGTLAWSMALARWLAPYGSHTIAGYRAANVALQGSEHEVGLAIGILDGHVGGRPARGFIDLHGATHVIKRSWVDGRLFKLGGLWDTVAGLGLAFEHRLRRHLRLGWHLGGRWVWVFTSTQRQLRAGLRLEGEPRPGHVLGAMVTGYLIHRDARQFGRRLPRVGGVAHAELRYGYLVRRRLGPVVRLRYSTGFRSGEAPVYEVRAETLTTHYADLWVGIAAAF